MQERGCASLATTRKSLPVSNVMAGNQGEAVGRSKARPRKQQPPSVRQKPGSPPKKQFWRRPLVWLGATGTAVLIGVLINVLSTQAQRVVPPPPSAGTGPTSPDSTTAAGAPLQVLSEDPVDSAFLLSVAFPGKVVLPKTQLNELKPGVVPKYLYLRGGYPTISDTQLVVQNTRNYGIQVLNMNVLKSCSSPMTGTLFYEPPQGAVLNVQVGFDLDSVDTEAKVENGFNLTATSPDYFSKYTVSIEPHGKEVFDISAQTSRHSCTFRYQFLILDGQKRTIQVVGDGSAPFKVTAVVAGAGRNPFSSYEGLYVVGNFGIPGDLDGYAMTDPKTFAF